MGNDIDPSVGFYLAATKVMLILDLIASYPLVFAAGRQIVERSLLSSDSDGLAAGIEPQRLAIRMCMVVFTVMLAQFDDFGSIISIVGGFAQVSLAFVMPSAIALKAK